MLTTEIRSADTVTLTVFCITNSIIFQLNVINYLLFLGMLRTSSVTKHTECITYLCNVYITNLFVCLFFLKKKKKIQITNYDLMM